MFLDKKRCPVCDIELEAGDKVYRAGLDIIGCEYCTDVDTVEFDEDEDEDEDEDDGPDWDAIRDEQYHERLFGL